MRYFLLIFLGFLIISGCGSSPQRGSTDIRQAEGDKYYGGVFRVNEVEYFRSLYPLNVTEVGGHRITNQIYEGLVMIDQSDLSVKPCIAESWEIDDDAKVFTFNIRRGVFFHDDPSFANGRGREVTAYDFEYCFTRLSTSDVNNQGYKFFERVLGSTEYFQSTIAGNPLPEGVAGIQVIDSFTLQIELMQPFRKFLYILALPFTSVFPREAFEAYGNEMRVKTVGTGPFYISNLREDEVVFLARNENYWGKDDHGNQLPYLDGVRFSFIKDKQSELMEFRRGNLELAFKLPLENFAEVVENDQLRPDFSQYVLQAMPSFTIQYYGFLHPHEIFRDINVRKAFNYAVNRKQIVDFTLKGTAVEGTTGVVPPSMPGYNASSIRGYAYDPYQAQQFMERAGYPNGRGFPAITLQINSGGGRNEQVAEAIQKMLQDNLNIQVSITKLPFAQHLENLETGKAHFWRSGWIADYPDPENFLTLFYSKHIPERLSDKSYLNSTRYKNPRFDALFEQALNTPDEAEREQLFMQADQIVMDDAAVMLLFYDKDYRLLQPYVRNFPQNPMEYRNFREVYFTPQHGQETELQAEL